MNFISKNSSRDIIPIVVVLFLTSIVKSSVAASVLGKCTGGVITLTNPTTRVIGMTGSDAQPSCQIKIPKQPHICQIRVDFLNFNMGMAYDDGTCGNDIVSFTGATNLQNGFTLCGQATNQHLYLHYGDGDGCSISINTNLEIPHSNYDLQITMIECNSPDKAPQGCTQYYNTSSHEVSSFNYPNQQLNDEKYSVCIGSVGKSITWKPCDSSYNSSTFFLTGDTSSIPNYLHGDQCKTDFVMIPPNNIICGSYFPVSLKSSATPYILYVNFDESEIPPLPQMNPETGCPLGFTCANTIFCSDGDTCDAPRWFPHPDIGSTGFCLKYFTS